MSVSDYRAIESKHLPVAVTLIKRVITKNVVIHPFAVTKISFPGFASDRTQGMMYPTAEY